MAASAAKPHSQGCLLVCVCCVAAAVVVGVPYRRYVRHRFVTIGILLIQLAGITGFAQLCFTRSAYFKLSTLGRSQLGGI
jgi:hypothetical protein